MTTLGRLVKIGVGVGAVAAALSLFAGSPAQASASTGSGEASGSGEFTTLWNVTHQEFATSCADFWSGPVTSDDGNSLTASVDNFSMACDQGVSVTPNALPWSLNVSSFSDFLGRWGAFDLEGIDLNITTAQGTCRYTGSMRGVAEDQGYLVSGTLSQQSAGCGGDAQISINNSLYSFGVN